MAFLESVHIMYNEHVLYISMYIMYMCSVRAFIYAMRDVLFIKLQFKIGGGRDVVIIGAKFTSLLLVAPGYPAGFVLVIEPYATCRWWTNISNGVGSHLAY